MKVWLKQAWRALAPLGLGGLLLQPIPAAATSPEAQVKAAYIYKLASFVRWPDDAANHGDFRLCVTGRRDVAQVLQQLVRGESIAGLPVEVVELDGGKAEQARNCRVLFLGRGVPAASGRNPTR